MMISTWTFVFITCRTMESLIPTYYVHIFMFRLMQLQIMPARGIGMGGGGGEGMGAGLILPVNC